ncbi:hypothetical protein Misp06_04364 [Microbulbifer sp. NBRC 101763]|uniref:hypothetical protein n=1 Tax=unclassified Microbulbifer TaxID=2619833 RepID=UPI0024AD0096|nr:hypothetical protein [Microbulbifer sp. MLAF003]WHI50449.1 hypothetical protein P3339_18700 [Microbulbifer sp. MLAF003]
MDYDSSGLHDAGEVSITLIWKEDDSGQQALRDDYDIGNRRVCRPDVVYEC